eukprot:TRINITY_DN141384_c0_g1_i1.p1 TRINITY_DN141384_c0_g1~~TRINITY_DN141384_c0_g1_i1.p1  ORF type:complete len:1025 (+),score=128.60 TRINITY_DN141384_c0_g1_i1:89-3163(+)
MKNIWNVSFLVFISGFIAQIFCEELLDIPIISLFEPASYGPVFNPQLQKSVELSAENNDAMSHYAQISIHSKEQQEFKSLFYFDKILAIIGVSTAIATQELSYMNDITLGLPIISQSQASLPESTSSIFQLTNTSSRKSMAIASLIKATSWSRVFFFIDEVAYGKSMLENISSVMDPSQTDIIRGPPLKEDPEKLFEYVFSEGARVIVLHGYSDQIYNVLWYGIKHGYIGESSDGSILFILSPFESCTILIKRSVAMTAQTLLHNLRGHICLQYSPEIDPNFQDAIWNPATTDRKLTAVEKETTSMSNWVGSNMVDGVPIAYDSVSFLINSLELMCQVTNTTDVVEMNRIRECLEHAVSPNGHEDFFHILENNTSFEGVSGRKVNESDPITMFIGAEKNLYFSWIPFATNLGENEDDITPCDLKDLIWPNGDSIIHKDMVERKIDFCDIVICLICIAMLLFILCEIVAVLTHKFWMNLGLLRVSEVIVMLLCAMLVSIRVLLMFLPGQKTTLRCYFISVTKYMMFVPVWVSFLALYRFRSIIVNRTMNKSRTSSKWFFWKWLFGCLMLYIGFEILFSGFDGSSKLLRDNSGSAEYDIYCTAVLEGHNHSGFAYYFSTQLAWHIVSTIVSVMCLKNIMEVMIYAKKWLQRSKRYSHFKKLLCIFTIIFFVMSMEIARYVLKPDGSQWINHPAHDSAKFYDDDLHITPSEMRYELFYNSLSELIYGCFMISLGMFAEMLFGATLWNKRYKHSNKRIHERETEMPKTSVSVDVRYMYQKHVLPSNSARHFNSNSLSGTNRSNHHYTLSPKLLKSISVNKFTDIKRTPTVLNRSSSSLSSLPSSFNLDNRSNEMKNVVAMIHSPKKMNGNKDRRHHYQQQPQHRQKHQELPNEHQSDIDYATPKSPRSFNIGLGARIGTLTAESTNLDANLSNLPHKMTMVKENDNQHMKKCLNFSMLLLCMDRVGKIDLLKDIDKKLDVLKRKHMSKQRFVKNTEEKLHIDIERLEIISIRLQRDMKKYRKGQIHPT